MSPVDLNDYMNQMTQIPTSVRILQAANVILNLLPLVISIVTLILVIKIYRRK